MPRRTTPATEGGPPATARTERPTAPAATTPPAGPPAGRPSRLQMADIARLANVSISTVSRALTDHPRLSVHTKQRILELAKSLNYSVNAGAQMLRGKSLQTVAVAFPYHPEQRNHFQDPFFLATLGSIGDALIDSGHSMLIVPVRADRSEALTQPHETGLAIGTIILGQEDNHPLYNRLAVRDMPFVVWGARLPDQLYCTVGGDNFLGGFQATEHLIRCGAKRIAFLGDRRLAEVGQRYEGYLKAHEVLGKKVAQELYRPIPIAEADARAEARRLLQDAIPFDAILASADVIALPVMKTLQEAGLRIPEDVMVVGYDDIAAAATASPPLTTVRQDINQGGRLLVQLLMDKLQGQRVQSVMLPTSLVVRGSTRSPTRRRSKTAAPGTTDPL